MLPFTDEYFDIRRRYQKRICRICQEERRKRGNLESQGRAKERRRKFLHEKEKDFCSVCGYNKCFAALDYHHLDPSTKKFNISQMGYNCSERLFREELEKCICLCANCHRELHEEERRKREWIIEI